MKTHLILAAFVLISSPAAAKKAGKADEDLKTEPTVTEPAASETKPSTVGVTAMSGREAFEKTVEDLRTGVGMVHAESLSMGGGGGYPLTLDKQANGPCTACFTDALGDPVADPRWVKTGNVYAFTDGDFTGEFAYDPATGKIDIKK